MKNLLNKWFFIARFHLQDPDSEYGSGSSRRFESGSTRFPIPNTDSHPPSLRRTVVIGTVQTGLRIRPFFGVDPDIFIWIRIGTLSCFCNVVLTITVKVQS